MGVTPSTFLHNFGQNYFGINGIEFSFPIYIWHWWPRNSNDNGLLMLRNSFFQKFSNVSWHSARHFPQFHNKKFLVLQAITQDDLVQLESLLKQGWDPNKVIDTAEQFNCVTLACHLDRLEALHLLDMYGADLNQGAGKFNNTPLMTALAKWNVRIIDYLMERQVDPSVQDKFGFTAKQKAQIRQLRTIQQMLESYEQKFKKKMPKTSPITNEVWQKEFKILNARLAKARLPQVDPKDYTTVKMISKDNQISKFKPSQLLSVGDYPLANLQSNSFTFSVFGNFMLFNSNDYKLIV